MPDTVTPWTAAHQASPILPQFAQIHVHWVSDAIQPSHLLLTPSPPALNLSQHQGLFQWVGSWHQVAKVWELPLQISLSSEYSGLISFKIDWFDLFAVQGTLKSLLQPHSLKVSVLPCSAFGAQSIWSHGPKPCLTQWNYEPCCVGPPKMDGSWWRVLTNRVHWRRERQTTSVFLPWEPHEQDEKDVDCIPV